MNDGNRGTPVPRPGAGALRRLVARAAEEGPPLAVVAERPASGPVFAELVAAGPRTARAPDSYAFVVEAVREGYLCHYETSRILDRPDPDLALLAGDLFYALGIRALADLEDVESVRMLSDLIRVSAELRSGNLRDAAESIWIATIVALSCGSDAEYERLSGLFSSGDAAVREALDEWSEACANSNGLGRILAEVREAIHFRSGT
jgi:hypothetical protein